MKPDDAAPSREEMHRRMQEMIRMIRNSLAESAPSAGPADPGGDRPRELPRDPGPDGSAVDESRPGEQLNG